jgi:O-antigen/teichoic acid export membrane protein
LNKKMTFINLAANLVALLLSIIINFFLTPFIVENIGQAAYGFIALANSMITYITVVTLAINSMANRFISIQIFKGNINKANQYFSSVVIANLLVSSLVIVVCVPLIINLDKFISIPVELHIDVKWLFSLILINFIINLISVIYTVGVFVKDKLYLNSIRSAQSVFLKGLALVALFAVFDARLLFVGIATLVATVFALLWNRYYTRKLTPFLKITVKDFKFLSIKELISSGIWNSINKLSSILHDGLSLLICNILIGPGPMGLMSIAKVVPSMVYNTLGSITSVFSPNLTKNFAYSKPDAMVNTLNNSIKIMGTLLNVPIVVFIAFGREFFQLWVPSTDTDAIYIVAVLSIAPLILSGSTACIYDVFSITNKLKLQSLVVLAVACLDLALILFTLKVTDFGIYAIVAIPCFTSYIKNLVFTFPYAAHCIGQKWYIFYRPAFRSVFCVIVSFFTINSLKRFMDSSTWLEFFLSVAISSIICLIINALLIWNLNDYKKILDLFRDKYIAKN